MTVHINDNLFTCCFDSDHVSTVYVRFPEGALLEVVGMDRRHAARLEGFNQDGSPIWNQQSPLRPEHPSVEPVLQPQVRWSCCTVRGIAGELYRSTIACGANAKHLEEVGILRGYGWYGARVKLSKQKRVEGFLLHEGADVLSFYVNGRYHGTVTPGGGTAFLPALKPIESLEVALVVRAEIWGHSNFDDARLPAIRLNALRGLSGITAVTTQRDFRKNWRFAPVLTDEQKHDFLQPVQDITHWIIVDWANWLTTCQPHAGCFRKQFVASAEANSWTLHFPGLQSLTEVFVNGKWMGHINPYTPYLDISAVVRPGQTVEVGIYLEKFYSAPGGKITLLEGIAAEDWWIAGSGETDLAAMDAEDRSHATRTDLPFGLPAGEVSWLWADLPDLSGCWTIRFTGRNAKISVFFNRKLIGRVWLPTDVIRPRMAGGADDLIYLPGPWFQKGGNTLALLVESVKLGAEAEITKIEFQPVR